jgi:hypothetical protein
MLSLSVTRKSFCSHPISGDHTSLLIDDESCLGPCRVSRVCDEPQPKCPMPARPSRPRGVVRATLSFALTFVFLRVKSKLNRT